MDEFSRERVVIENLSPSIDCGRFPIKRVAGERVVVEADVFADGHDELDVVLLYRHDGDEQWSSEPMRHLGNDRWQASFVASQVGVDLYTVSAKVDAYRTWLKKLATLCDAHQDVSLELRVGAALMEQVARRARGSDAAMLRHVADDIRKEGCTQGARDAASAPGVVELMRRHAERDKATTHLPEHRVTVDPPRAEFSAWYEVFPRSCASEPGRHGTFRDCEDRLPYIAGMGFDVLYLPPIHPIGVTARKGRNNAVQCEPGDPGTPWAIGSSAGGHKAINPALGTLEEFRSLLEKARGYGIEIALDIAFQCSPDHPYVSEHPEWFRRRPDGSVQYAENPPKKYQDIYPLEFDSSDRAALWHELRSVVQFWIDQGVTIFRVDNPHTKPFAFWEWLIVSLKERHPDLIFLAEAFTRPKVMARLAKLGFTQSYTYFTWRRSKWELVEYITELTRTELVEYFRPNFWPNTPDILMDYLQEGGKPAFQVRLVLAATLSSNYGIYGPAFELCVNVPREPGSEEYLHSEKYELKHWDLDDPASISPLITRVNQIRRESRALQSMRNVRVQHVDNNHLMAYSRWDESRPELLLVVVNLDAHRIQSGVITMDSDLPGLPPPGQYGVQDLLTGQRYIWSGLRNYVLLDPSVLPAHIFRIDVDGAAGVDGGRR
ncbi:MAG: alpha-1,4-glucan--maltose-1-phosphate maltosyltransferase [Dehalococcoidia bacterium]|nr:alpha-1,4-glucan--maltose-1-phosphate maltosyltransferase [Dehalococcoidia bacterium]